jgi:hypothetical protein
MQLVRDRDGTWKDSGLSRPRQTLDYEALREAIKGLVEGKGARGAMIHHIRTQPLLLSLRVVTDRVKATSRDDVIALERSFQEVFEPICGALKPEKRAVAAKALFGFDGDCLELSMTRRRQVAGEAVGCTGRGAWDAFRKRHEPTIIQDLANELYLLETSPLLESPVPPAVRPLVEQTQQPPIEPAVTEELGQERTIRYRGYAWIGAELIYQVSDEDLRRHTYTTVREFEVVHPNPEPFQDRYQWSGHGQEGVPQVLSEGHRLLGEPFEAGSYKVYYVHFDNGLQVGQRTKIHIRQELYDSDMEFHPFLGAPAHQSQEWLTLRVILPVRHAPSQIALKTYASRAPDAVLLRSRPGHLKRWKDPRYGVIDWHVRSLIQDRYYAIEWGYDWGFQDREDSFYPPDF